MEPEKVMFCRDPHETLDEGSATLAVRIDPPAYTYFGYADGTAITTFCSKTYPSLAMMLTFLLAFGKKVVYDRGGIVGYFHIRHDRRRGIDSFFIFIFLGRTLKNKK